MQPQVLQRLQVAYFVRQACNLVVSYVEFLQILELWEVAQTFQLVTCKVEALQLEQVEELLRQAFVGDFVVACIQDS